MCVNSPRVPDAITCPVECYRFMNKSLLIDWSILSTFYSLITILKRHFSTWFYIFDHTQIKGLKTAEVLSIVFVLNPSAVQSKSCMRLKTRPVVFNFDRLKWDAKRIYTYQLICKYITNKSIDNCYFSVGK